MNSGSSGKDPIEQRLTCMGKRLKPDDREELSVTIDNIHAIFESCGRSVVNIVGAAGAYDKGRLIAALDALEQAKNIAIQAIHLAQ